MRRLTKSVQAVINIGLSGEETDAQARRIRILNLVALIALALDTFWTTVYVVLDRAAFGPVLLPNGVAGVGYVTALLLSWRRRHVTSFWVLFISTAFNLTSAGLFFGLTGGIWLYLMLLPALGVLFVRIDDGVELAVLVVGGSTLFAIVGLMAGDGPDVIAGTPFESATFLFSAWTTALIASIVTLYYRRLAERAEARSDWLLLNILPAPIAQRLKAGESPIADRIAEVSVIFGDIVGSTELADRLSADDMVALLDRLFSAFDEIVDECGLEKIKTTGDAYIAVAGLEPESDHAAAAAAAALRMRRELQEQFAAGAERVEMRFGIHLGPVVAGVIGKRKFSYDLWGDTMNTASRMESTGLPGAIQVSAQIRHRLGDRFTFEPRGRLTVKGKGELETFWLVAHPEDEVPTSRDGANRPRRTPE